MYLNPQIDTELLAKYDRPGPRYTSYPTAPNWSDDFGAEDYTARLRRAGTVRTAPRSIIQIDNPKGEWESDEILNEICGTYLRHQLAGRVRHL